MMSRDGCAKSMIRRYDRHDVELAATDDDDMSRCSVATEEHRDDDAGWMEGMDEVVEGTRVDGAVHRDMHGTTTVFGTKATTAPYSSISPSTMMPGDDPLLPIDVNHEKVRELGGRGRRRRGRERKTTPPIVVVVEREKDSGDDDDDDDVDEEWYTGRIVGLRLPRDVDPGYEMRKPSDCRVDPNEFLPLSPNISMGTTANDGTVAGTGEQRGGGGRRRRGTPGGTKRNDDDDRDDRWMCWKEGEDGRDYRDVDATNVALDVRVSVNRRRRGGGGGAHSSSWTNDEICHVRMTRDPYEAVHKTLQRLRLSVQKKVRGSTTTMKTMKKGEKSKKEGYGKAAGHDERDDDEDVLLLKRKNEKRIIRGGDDDVTSTTTPSSRDDYDAEVMACIAYWDGLLSKLALPINPCNPWNITPWENRNSSSADEGDIIRVGRGSDKATDNEGDFMDGYELVNVENSLTIGEVLRLAMTVADDIEGYAVSVPVARSSSRIPITIESCPPTITRVSTFGSFIETHLFVNTPIVVDVGLLYSTGALITWFVDHERVRADGPCYTPIESDIGKVLTVVIVPQRPGHDGGERMEAFQFKRRVEALPPLPIMRPLREEFMNRSSNVVPQKQWQDKETTDKNDSTMTLRVVTYNILADQNLSRDVDKHDDADRVYSHCRKEHLVKWRRHPLIIHEILEYRPDVIALQEVDTDIYTDLFRPVLKAKGYEGFFSQKGVDANSGVREGCAMFWSLDAFESVRPVDMHTHSFREMIQEFTCEEAMRTSQWKSLKHMSELLDKHDKLKRIMLDKLGHILQTVVLTQRQSGEKLVVGNTHLFYHPMASHVRCLKTLIACRQLEILHRENQLCPIIFCGDLNSHPESGVMKLLLNRYLNANNGMTWKHLCVYEWEEGEGSEVHHDVEAIDLEFPPSFPNLKSGYPIPPDFTHYIEAFSGTLDYILITNNFEVEKTGATPTRDVVKKYVAMPNECMPSDHVSLVCDLKWR